MGGCRVCEEAKVWPARTNRQTDSGIRGQCESRKDRSNEVRCTRELQEKIAHWRQEQQSNVESWNREFWNEGTRFESTSNNPR